MIDIGVITNYEMPGDAMRHDFDLKWGLPLNRFICLACALLLGLNTAAQVISPRLDPVTEMRGKALVEALRGGGYILYMRHAVSGAASAQCNGQSALTTIGEGQARTVGAALHAMAIPVNTVWTSRTCRTEQTARLLGVGSVQTTDSLNPGGGALGTELAVIRKKLLTESPPIGFNTVLVSHVHSAQTPEDVLSLDYAEVIVYRGLGNGSPEPIARITVQDWAGLQAAVEKLQP